MEEIPEGHFLTYLKLIKKYQRTEPSLMDKYKFYTYHKGSFPGVINIDLNPITCKYNNFIP